MKKNTELYLIRHGEAENTTRDNYIAGRSNHLPLTEKGMRQAQRLGAALSRLSLFAGPVYSSPAIRALQTAEHALDAAAFDKIVTDDRLQELGAGEWTGRTATDVFTDEQVAEINRQGKDFRPPSGESFNDVGERVYEWANTVPHGERVIAFTHGGAIRCLASKTEAWSHARTYQTQPDHTSISLFTHDGEGWALQYIGKNIEEIS